MAGVWPGVLSILQEYIWSKRIGWKVCEEYTMVGGERMSIFGARGGYIHSHIHIHKRAGRQDRLGWLTLSISSR